MKITAADKELVIIFLELQEEMSVVRKRQVSQGWGQRNTLISHVYSNYTLHEELVAARTKWESTTLHSKVLDYLYDLMKQYRDIWGYFPDYKKMIIELDSFIELAIFKEEFEIAGIIQTWRKKFPK